MGTGITIRDDSTVTIPEHVLCRRAAGETILLNLADEQYYGLDGVGSRLWELIEAGTSFGGAVTTLLGEYEVSREALVADLTKLLDDLSQSNLVLIDAS